jgi:hypothetical protein
MSADLARCRFCGRLVKVRDDGRLAKHSIRIPVSRRATRTVGRGQVTRPCSGSGTVPQ